MRADEHFVRQSKRAENFRLAGEAMARQASSAAKSLRAFIEACAKINLEETLNKTNQRF